METESFKANPKYKDRVFCMLFGREESKANALALYNALQKTSYTNLDDLSITTIDDAIYIKMKNDVSILIDGNIVLFEQQSTINPNMPLRGFMYMSHIYSAYLGQNKLNVYGSSLIHIPTPQYFVLYNGKSDYEARETLRLSDAFIHSDENIRRDFEWTATVININEGKNDELLKSCRPLWEYMELVNAVNRNSKVEPDFNIALDKAIAECISNGILKEFLEKHRTEVRDVFIFDYNQEAYEKSLRDEGTERTLVSLVKDGLLSAAEAAKRLGLSEERFNVKYLTAK